MTTPRIAIVGAGVAGLDAALTPQDGTNRVPPYASTIFEGQNYVGGRMHSGTTSWADGQVSEWCGELIDSGHTAIMNLATRFNLPLTDLLAAQPAGSTDLNHLFGRYYPYSQAVTDFGPVYRTLRDQIKAAGYPTLYNSYNTAGAKPVNPTITSISLISRPDQKMRPRPAATCCVESAAYHSGSTSGSQRKRVGDLVFRHGGSAQRHLWRHKRRHERDAAWNSLLVTAGSAYAPPGRAHFLAVVDATMTRKH